MGNINDFGFPFTSNGGDRQYNSAEWRQFFKSLITSGVLMNTGNELSVHPQAVPNKTVYVNTGAILIEGAMRIMETTTDLTVADNASGNPRIDRIVARLNFAERKIEFIVKQGTPAPSPVPPSLTRDATAWELSLARITLINGFTVITEAEITDERSNPDMCGYASIIAALATQAAAGLMSAGDKTKLDNIEENANKYVHPTTAGNKHIPSGGAADQILRYSASGTAAWSHESAEKAKLSATVASLYGLSAPNDNADKALEKILDYTGYKCVTFTSNGNFVVPANVNSVVLLGCAAGGPGTTTGRAKAGEAAIYKKISVTPGQNISVTVGSGNTIFGSYLTLLANNLALDAELQWGGTKLGLGGTTSSVGNPAPPVKPLGFEHLSPGGTFKIHGVKELSELDFVIGTSAVLGGSGSITNVSPGYGGYFGFGGVTTLYADGSHGNAGGFGAGGGGASGGTMGLGRPGFLVVMYKEGQ